MDQTQRFCAYCQRNVVATRKGTSHIFHLIATIFTGGLWLLVWIPSMVKFGGWRCMQCGGNKLEGPRQLPPQPQWGGQQYGPPPGQWGPPPGQGHPPQGGGFPQA